MLHVERWLERMGYHEDKDAIKASSYATSDMIKVYVGQERHCFCIHKLLLCTYSEFFEKCIGNYNFLEGNLGEVSLPDDETDTFKIIVDWLYHDGPVAPLDLPEEVTYVKAYLLADRLIMPRCKDDILDAIREYHNDNVVSAHTFDALPTDLLKSKLPARYYYQDQFAYDMMNTPEAFLTRNENRLRPAERKMFKGMCARDGHDMIMFLEKLVQYLRAGSSADDPEDQTCTYHSHGKDEAYPSCVRKE